MKKAPLIALILALQPLVSAAADERWSVRPYVGVSQMSDVTGNSSAVGAVDGALDVDLDSGFTAGFAVGYALNERWDAEFAWEYRSNDSATTLADGTRFADGNYASNLISVSAAYAFSPRGRWQPYIGAGLTWAQEIDIDLETAGVETSFEGDGDVGYRLFAGVDYELAERWSVNGELRYGSTTGITLANEAAPGSEFTDLDYEPLTLAVGLRYRF